MEMGRLTWRHVTDFQDSVAKLLPCLSVVQNSWFPDCANLDWLAIIFLLTSDLCSGKLILFMIN